jgi:diacylglycerol kinase family enzyme
VDTGVLDIVVLPEDSLLSIARYLAWAKFGRIDRLSNVTYLKGRNVLIQSESPIPVELDGDFFGRHDTVEIRLLPAAVPLVAP